MSCEAPDLHCLVVRAAQEVDAVDGRAVVQDRPLDVYGDRDRERDRTELDVVALALRREKPNK
jgi:hypothetical protein